MTDSPYEELYERLQAQYLRTARFVAAAFHVHSVASHDWGRGGDAALNNPDRFKASGGPKAFLDELVAAGLEIVCITDHMKSSYACEVARLASERDEISVFPGVEVSCTVGPAHSERIHLLAVFRPETGAGVIERIYDGIPDEAARDGREEIRVGSLAEWRGRVEREGGMLILAHVDQEPRGHRSYVRGVLGEQVKMLAIDPQGVETIRDISDLYAEYLVDVAPDAVEVRRSADRTHYIDFSTADGRRHSVPCVAHSDHHSLEALRSGEGITHLKVSRPTFDCVRDALRFQETRVRFNDELPIAPTPRLVGLRIHSGAGGLFRDVEIAFNENLNCLIGPRGAGKTTIVEALRYVLGQQHLLEREPPSEGGFAEIAREISSANLADSQIELIYEAGGVPHLLSATYDPDRPATTRAFTLEGTDCQVPPEATEAAYPARIFSWSELEMLGREPRLQRTVVDRLAEELPALAEQAGEMRSELAANRREVAAITSRLRELLAAEGGALGRFAEFRGAFDRMNTPEVAALFAEMDTVRKRVAALEEVNKSLASVADQLEAVESAAPAARLAELLGEDQELATWWTEHFAGEVDLPGIEVIARRQLALLGDAITARRGALDAELEKQRLKLAATDEELRQRADADPGATLEREHREEARRRYETAGELRRRYLDTFAEAEQALEARGALLEQLEELREQIADVRAGTAATLTAKLGELGEATPEVEIEVKAGADREQLVAFLEGEFLNQQRGGQYRSQGLAARLARRRPAEIAWAILSQDRTMLGGDDRGPSSQQVERLINAFSGLFVRNEGAEVILIDEALEELLVLQEQPLEDTVRILAAGQPVDRLSPGGRSSAMLPLIALSDEAPLIIDQPEDNLDNRMVGSTLASILAHLKEHRQIIVTTHNPNIVVGGDAEQVIVLRDTGVHSAELDHTGNIDDDSIIERVIKIMEGGKEAFEARERRYKSHLDGR